jgi:hypothetical protein
MTDSSEILIQWSLEQNKSPEWYIGYQPYLKRNLNKRNTFYNI